MTVENNHRAGDLLKIGDFARLADTNLRTLRYYEEVGLLVPAARSKGGFRYYRPTDVNRLRTVNVLQDLGLTLEEIRELISTRAREGESSRDEFFRRVRKALQSQRELFEHRIDELQGRRDRIDAALVKLNECASCEVTPSPENNYCEPCSLRSAELPADLSALF